MTDIEPVRTGPAAIEGMEDIGASDLVLPILKIAHKATPMGLEDSLTNEVHPTLNTIVLGVVKQRILWPAEPGAEGDGPICRSYDFHIGKPDTDKFLSIVEKTRTGHPTGFSTDQINSGSLPCAECPLKDWGTHPRGDKPWCDEQWTVPLLIIGDDGSYSPALISFQRTGIKPIKNYVTAFASRQNPLYTAVTRLEVQSQMKGSNPYGVPKFTKVSDSDPMMWEHFSAQYRNIRDFITTPRVRRDDDDDTSTGTPAAAAAPPAPAPAPATAPPAPAPAPEPAPAEGPAATAEVVDDLVSDTPPIHRPQPAAPAPAPAAAPATDVDPDAVPF